jgi:large subunit ribosomal protein L14
MIQSGTFLNVIDNSGAKLVCCIKVMRGFKRRYASMGDVVLVSVKTLRKKRRLFSKVKKGEIYRALIIRTKIGVNYISSDNLKFLTNSVVLLKRQNKLIGTRVFGSISKNFRYTKYMRLVSLSAGLVS